MKLRKRRRNRQGAAVIELAVCLPVIFLIVLGSIQAASLLFLRQALVQAAYEGAKIAIRSDGTNSAAENAIINVANGRNLQGVNVQFSEGDVSSTNPGTAISVTVTAPGDDNTFFPFGPFAGNNVTAVAVMVKE